MRYMRQTKSRRMTYVEGLQYTIDHGKDAQNALR
jgi:hypothetical protein